MIRYLSTALLTLALFYLETLNITSCYDKNGEIVDGYCKVKVHLIENRIWYALIILVLFALINFIVTYKENNKLINNLNDFLYQFFDNNLQREKENHRVTIFETKYGINIFFGYLWHTLARLKYYKNCNKLRYRYNKTPIPWFKYLVVHSRCGLPNENYRSTIFRLSRNEKDVNSFAEYSYHTGQTESAELPDIYNYDFTKESDLSNFSKSKQRKIETYMKKSKIVTFDSLKMFGRRTPYIAAIPLFTKKKSMNYPTHIIMYDSLTKPFKEIQKELKDFSEFIEIILKNS